MQRLLGAVMLLIGVIGVGISIFGMIVGQRLVDEMAAGLDANLALTLESLDTVHDSLLLTQEMVSDINEGLATVETTADNAAVALNNTGPLLRQISSVTSEEVPETLETVQESIPALLEVATTIDETLYVLSDFQIDRSVLGIPLRWDLGINYDPEVPFAASVDQLGNSLEGLPSQLRGLQTYADVTEENINTIGRDMLAIADNLSAINESVGELDPLLDDYLATVTDFSDSLRQSRALLSEQIRMVKIVLTVILAWIGLTQIAPLYLGWELVTQRR